MQIIAVCVVQNEVDVIAESLTWSLRFCDHIWVWDLHSEDLTWEILSRLRHPRIAVARGPAEPYTSALRGRMVGELRTELPENCWIYVLDADEFVMGDPRRHLAQAETESRSLVAGWHVNFYPTREALAAIRSLGDARWEAIPLHDRLRYYRVEWLEGRFIRLSPDLSWEAAGFYNLIRDGRGARLQLARQRLLIRHYRYRSRSQIALRHRTRSVSPPAGYAGFRYDVSPDFEHYVRDQSRCRYWNGRPDGIRVTVTDAVRVAWRMNVKKFVRCLHPGR